MVGSLILHSIITTGFKAPENQNSRRHFCQEDCLQLGRLHAHDYVLLAQQLCYLSGRCMQPCEAYYRRHLKKQFYWNNWGMSVNILQLKKLPKP